MASCWRMNDLRVSAYMHTPLVALGWSTCACSVVLHWHVRPCYMSLVFQNEFSSGRVELTFCSIFDGFVCVGDCSAHEPHVCCIGIWYQRGFAHHLGCRNTGSVAGTASTHGHREGHRVQSRYGQAIQHLLCDQSFSNTDII